MAHQDYFTQFEQSIVRCGENGRSQKNHLTTCKQNLAGLTWPELGSNPQRREDKRFRVLKISVLNHSATSDQFGLDNRPTQKYWTQPYLSLLIIVEDIFDVIRHLDRVGQVFFVHIIYILKSRFYD